MATVAVYDITNNQVGDIELNDSIFGVEMNAGLLHQAVVMQLEPRRRLRWWPQAVEAEGHGPCTCWFDAQPAVGWRWYGLRTASAQVCVQHAAQAASPRTQVRTLR